MSPFCSSYFNFTSRSWPVVPVCYLRGPIVLFGALVHFGGCSNDIHSLWCFVELGSESNSRSTILSRGYSIFRRCSKKILRITSSSMLRLIQSFRKRNPNSWGRTRSKKVCSRSYSQCFLFHKPMHNGESEIRPHFLNILQWTPTLHHRFSLYFRSMLTFAVVFSAFYWILEAARSPPRSWRLAWR